MDVLCKGLAGPVMVKVLIAEENDALVHALQSLSEELGLTLLRAFDGHKTLQIFESDKPDICFVDVLLAGLDGFEICKVIKRRLGAVGTPVIITSSIFADQEMVAEDMRDSGADDFLAKPALHAVVRKMLFKHLPHLVQSVSQRAAVLRPSGGAGVSTRPGATTDSGGHPRKKRVLVVEDQEDLHYIYRGFVTAMGLEAVGAFDGEVALQVFEETKPDLCLVDLLLPGINGFEVCRRIKSQDHGADIPVIVMSAVYRNVNQLEHDLQRYGADDFLHKPFSMDALHELLLYYLPGEDEIFGNSPSSPIPSTNEMRHDLQKHLVVRLTEDGSLSDVDFASLFFKILNDGLTGRLVVRRDEQMREIHFQKGHPINAVSNSADESLGTLLAQRGLLTMEQVNAVMLDSAFSGHMGEEFVRRELITEAELALVLREQVRQRILGCFGLTDGTYRFDAMGEDEIDVPYTVDLNPLEIIRDGVARFTSPNELAEMMQGFVHRYVTPTSFYTNFFALFPATEDERRFMASFDGRRTLSELLQLRVLDITPALELVWSLHTARMIIFSEVPGDSLSRPVRRFELEEDTPSHDVSIEEDGVSIWSQIFGDS